MVGVVPVEQAGAELGAAVVLVLNLPRHAVNAFGLVVRGFGPKLR